MEDGQSKLRDDLAILEQMAAEMEEYLQSDVLFWRMMKGTMPRLTLGGYLMRQHRLLALRHLLEKEEQERLRRAVEKVEAVTGEWVVRVEQRAQQELGARLRQWTEYLRDLKGEEAGLAASNYATAVEARVMIAALLEHLSLPRYRLDSDVVHQVKMVDRGQRKGWQKGAFVWPEPWMPAYPVEAYWYLYTG